jgi:hypothetical protein
VKKPTRNLCTAICALLLPGAAFAQGAIATQGFGYPPGQLTTRAASAGGALTDFDQAGATNPAALMNWGVAGAYLQYSPELRRTTAGGKSTPATVARFPVIAIGLPVGGRYTIGLSSSTMLERSFITSTSVRQLIRRDSVTTLTTDTTRGAMNDVQFAGAMQVRPWLRLGTAIHVVTGSNRVRVTREIRPDTGVRFDTVSYGGTLEQSTATFAGTGISFGVELQPVKTLAFAGSARLGFGMRAELNDSVRRSADVPNRAGGSVRWDVAGTSLAARVNWEEWSALRGLGGESSGVFNTVEYGIGAELPGPKIRGGQVLLRLGARSRNLPYGVGGRQPTERIFGGGLGLPVGFGRAQLDLGIENASRKVPGLSGVSERGLILSFGFRLRT